MDDTDLARDVAAALRGRTIATAESFTAGRIATALAAVEGATDFLLGGLVAYREPVKRELLGVTAPSVLSELAATEMAVGARRLLGADVTVATTGLAGPDPIDGVAPGTVFIATAVGATTGATTHRLEGTPEEICDRATRRALLIVKRRLGSVTAG